MEGSGGEWRVWTHVFLRVLGSPYNYLHFHTFHTLHTLHFQKKKEIIIGRSDQR
jgi:hypothetical protein